MTFFCLLRGCQWRSMPVNDAVPGDCECCERCGALRHHLLQLPRR
ncbi:PSPA7_2676 family Cys-rich small protein [Pseudomonas bharatica]|nr:PSPA7_2676 family Cys-rich small protein [Pseudomonas bharatica]